MAYWRMQLHPGISVEAVRYTVACLAAKLIGLDFGSEPGPTPPAADVGDLLSVNPAALPENQRHYWAFATEMRGGDHVLIFAHNYPFALCRVAGAYTYARGIDPASGRWFRHFRRVDDVRYYGDHKTDARKWNSITMTGTIAPLREHNSKSYLLIKRWPKVPPNNEMQRTKPAQATELRR